MTPAVSRVAALLVNVILGAGAAQAQDGGNHPAVRQFRQGVERVVERTNRHIDAWRVNSGQYANTWTQKTCRVSNTEIDVQRTNSLVSPLLGIVTGEVHEYLGAGHDSEQAALSASPSTHDPPTYTVFRIEYAYQSGRWAMKDWRMKGELNATPEVKKLLPPTWFDSWSAENAGRDDGCMVKEYWEELATDG